MDITAGDRDTARRRARPGNLHRPCIRCPTLKYLKLVRDVCLFCSLPQQPNQTDMGDHPAIFDLDRRAITKRNRHRIALRHIAGSRYIQRQANVRLQAVSGRLRPPRANLFLHTKHKIEFMTNGRPLQLPQCFDSYGA